LDIFGTQARREVDLWSRVPDAPQRLHKRHVQPCCQFFRLIESAHDAAPRMKGNRYHEVGAAQDVLSVGVHQAHERSGQGPASVVFEGAQYRTQGAIVLADRTAARDDVPAVMARVTLVAVTPRLRGCEWKTAPPAERRCQEPDRRPAGAADGAVQRRLEDDATAQARRRQKEGEERVSSGLEPRDMEKITALPTSRPFAICELLALALHARQRCKLGAGAPG
jgi:hypothetical protein